MRRIRRRNLYEWRLVEGEHLFLEYVALERGSGRCVLFDERKREVCTVWLN